MIFLYFNQDKRSSSSRDTAFSDENFDEEAFSVKLEPDCTEGAYERERQKKENHNKSQSVGRGLKSGE